MNIIPTPYTWQEGSKQITVTAVTQAAVSVAASVIHRPVSVNQPQSMTPGQFARFQAAYRAVCKHPAAHYFAWTNRERTELYTCCCDCGQVLPPKQLKRA